MYLQNMTFSGPRGFGKNIDSNSFAKKILFQQSNNICFDLVQLFFLIMKYFPCMLEKNQFFFKFNNKLDFLIHHIKSSSSLIFILRIVIKYGVLKCGMKSYCKKGVQLKKKKNNVIMDEKSNGNIFPASEQHYYINISLSILMHFFSAIKSKMSHFLI